MRRILSLGPLVALFLLCLLVAGRAAAVAAQEGTPAAEEMAPPEGVSFEPLTAVQGVALPNPGDLVVVRIGIEAGSSLPSDPNDPSLGLFLVEAGEVTVNIDAPLRVTRAGSFAPALATAEAGGAFVSPEETAAARETVTLRVGDVALFPPNAGGEIRNDGAEPAVGLGFLVVPPETGGEATPTAGTASA